MFRSRFVFLLAFAPVLLAQGGIKFSGSLRTRVESWDWFTPSSGDPTYTFSGSTLRLNLSQSRESFRWNLEFAVPILLNLPENATGPGAQGGLGLGANYFGANQRRQNTAMIFPKQAWVEWKTSAGTIRTGRLEYADGSETAPKNATLAALKATRINMRLIGHFGWTHVGRSFDGGLYSKTSEKQALHVLAAVPTRGVFQTDGWGWNRAALQYAAYTRGWGTGRHTADTRVFGLAFQDWRTAVLKTDNRPLAQRRADSKGLAIGTFGGHSVHAIDSAAATYDILLWGAAQTGTWGGVSHRAWAGIAEAGFQPKAVALKRLRPWIRGGYTYSSGDGDPSDGRHGTFFQVLPTPRPFARFPFYNMMNTKDIYGGLTVRPHTRVSISSEFHSLSLAQKNDLWYAGGGVFQPWSFGYLGRSAGGAGSLANLYDASVDVKVTPAATLNLYYGKAQGLAAVRSIYPSGTSGQLGYVELSYKF